MQPPPNLDSLSHNSIVALVGFYSALVAKQSQQLQELQAKEQLYIKEIARLSKCLPPMVPTQDTLTSQPSATSQKQKEGQPPRSLSDPTDPNSNKGNA